MSRDEVAGRVKIERLAAGAKDGSATVVNGVASEKVGGELRELVAVEASKAIPARRNPNGEGDGITRHNHHRTGARARALHT